MSTPDDDAVEEVESAGAHSIEFTGLALGYRECHLETVALIGVIRHSEVSERGDDVIRSRQRDSVAHPQD